MVQFFRRTRKLRRRLLGGLVSLFSRAIKRIVAKVLVSLPTHHAAGIALRTDIGQRAAAHYLLRLPISKRRQALSGIAKILADRQHRQSFAETTWRIWHRSGTARALETAVFASLEAEDPLRARRAIETIRDPLVRNRLLPATIAAMYELADYTATVEATHRGTVLRPRELRMRYDFQKGAFAASQLLDTAAAYKFILYQFGFMNGDAQQKLSAQITALQEYIFQEVLSLTHKSIMLEMFKMGRQPRVGVFFLSSTQALGHAVLDPFHFIALNQGRFDKIYFIGPPRSAYAPASRIALQIVEQYGEYIETGSDLLLNLCWMSLGEFSAGNLTVIVDHYWGLVRSAVHRSRNPNDAYRHNAWHMKVPDCLEYKAKQICADAGIALDRPFVVLHARDSGYHQILKQAYRDSPIANYKDAIALLLDRGYQVIRIGDQKMPRLDLNRSGYFELPFLKYYRSFLDPYLIAYSDFMIGCQSGPCAYARVFGKPLLSINAVLHYTLLPSSREMACWKRYYIRENGTRREITLIEAIERGVAHFDNSFQLEEAGIEVEAATPEEITAATRDMLDWVGHPNRPETPEQMSFRQEVERIHMRLAERGNAKLPIGDYLGIVLGGYRISPSVARMRAGASGPASAANEASSRLGASSDDLRRAGHAVGL